jgi:hypothetical protein
VERKQHILLIFEAGIAQTLFVYVKVGEEKSLISFSEMSIRLGAALYKLHPKN